MPMWSRKVSRARARSSERLLRRKGGVPRDDGLVSGIRGPDRPVGRHRDGAWAEESRRRGLPFPGESEHLHAAVPRVGHVDEVPVDRDAARLAQLVGARASAAPATEKAAFAVEDPDPVRPEIRHPQPSAAVHGRVARLAHSRVGRLARRGRLRDRRRLFRFVGRRRSGGLGGGERPANRGDHVFGVGGGHAVDARLRILVGELEEIALRVEFRAAGPSARQGSPGLAVRSKSSAERPTYTYPTW